MDVKTSSLNKWLFLMFLVISAIVSTSWATANNATRRAKASAEYCMTCGCKRIIHDYSGAMDQAVFHYNGASLVETDPLNTFKKIYSSNGYTMFSFGQSQIDAMEGYYCRVTGRYKTTDMKYTDMYGEYCLNGEATYRPLPRGYIVGIPENVISGPDNWQSFSYDFMLLDIRGITNLRFCIRAPVADDDSKMPVTGYELDIAALKICAYNRDDFKYIALLSDLKAGAAIGTQEYPLNQTFMPFTMNYQVSDLANSITDIKITPTAKIVANTTTTITIQNISKTGSLPVPTTSGVPKIIPLDPGVNTIQVVATIPDGISMNYSITVNRGTNCDLSKYTITSSAPTVVRSLADGSLKRDVYKYYENLPGSVSSATVTLETFDPEATVSLNGIPVASKEKTFTLDYGNNPIEIIVTSPAPASGGYKHTYTLNIARAMDVTLKSLDISDHATTNEIKYSPALPTDIKDFISDDIDPDVTAVDIVASGNDGEATIEYFINNVATAFPLTIDNGTKDVTIRVTSSAPPPNIPEIANYTVALKKGVNTGLNSVAFYKKNGIDKYLYTKPSSNVFKIQTESLEDVIIFQIKTKDPGATMSCSWKTEDNSNSGPLVLEYDVKSVPAQLVEKKVTIFTIVVTARDRTKDTYTVRVARGEVPRELYFESDVSYAPTIANTVYIPVHINLNPLTGTVMVDYDRTGGSAVTPGDYVFSKGSLTFSQAGSDVLAIPVDVKYSPSYADDKTVVISLSNPTGSATIGTQYGGGTNTLTIYSQVEANFQGAGSSVTKSTTDQNANICVALSNPPKRNVSINYTIVAAEPPMQNAVMDDDYTILGNGHLFFPANESSPQCFNIKVKHDGTSTAPVLGVKIVLQESPNDVSPATDNKRIKIGQTSPAYLLTILQSDLVAPVLTSVTSSSPQLSINSNPLSGNDIVWLQGTNTSITSMNGTATDNISVTRVYSKGSNAVEGTVTQVNGDPKNVTWALGPINNFPERAETPFTVFASDASLNEGSKSIMVLQGDNMFKLNVPIKTGTTSEILINAGKCPLTWTAAAAIRNNGGVDVLVSNNGNSPWETVATGITSDQHFDWPLSGTVTSNTVAIKIVAHNYPTGNLSNQVSNLTLREKMGAPVAGNVWYEFSEYDVEWPVLLGVDYVDIRCDLDGDGTYESSIVTHVPNDGVYPWTIPQFWESNGAVAKIKVVASTDANLYVESDTFTIVRNNFVRKYILDLLH